MRYADGPTTEATVLVAAPPARVWPLVSDIFLIATVSRELQEVQWLPGCAGPALGARFRGRNFHPQVGEWTTISHVVEYDPPRAFAWAVEDPHQPAALWRFELVPHGEGTELRQRARLGPGPSNLTSIIELMPDKEERIVAGRLREFRAGMEANLSAIKERAEAG
ncbi:MAG TPA: SRPBCC family protein [Pseudonocardia sp.]|nr:SRPBCC family protein [Pseudonocardia sp.]